MAGRLTYLLCAACLVLGPEEALARDLTVVSYGGSLQDAVRDAFTAPFGASHGVHIADTTYSGDLSAIYAEVKAGDPHWDVVNVGAAQLLPGCRDGDYEMITPDAIQDRAAMIPTAVDLSPCGVGMLTGAVVLTYDTARLPIGPTGWADFWDVVKFPGKRGMKYDPEWTLEVALLADGVAPGDVNTVLNTQAGVDRAFAKLDAFKPNIKWWKLGGESVSDLESGAVVMSAAYNGRIVAANRDQHNHYAMVWDAGSVYFMDYFVVLKGSPNSKAAMAFIGYATGAEAQRSMPRYVGYGPANLAAYKGMDPALMDELPTEARLRRAVATDDQFWLDHRDALVARYNAWAAQ
jgi:putative spermidine/putrescine transport system substrate-binding protein